ncbi:MAG: glycosyl transferase family 2 [Bacteriovoracaceae bacterium]|nr:glycosyl transferase family 2 [Bacteriovoracaceae bacterium]
MISVCIIAKNEEKWIAECVSHLKPLATEIIVGDTGSTDRTVPLARDAGARVFEMEWEEDFAKARNRTIHEAREPWIFSFDADERISNRDLLKFTQTIEQIHPQSDIEAIRIHRRNYIANPLLSGFVPCAGDYPEEKMYAGYYKEQMIRIFRNLPHIRWQGKVHELIDRSLKGKTYESNLTFHHFGYLPEEESRRGKTRLYQEIGKKKLEDDPNNWKARYDLGSEYIQGGEIEKAILELEKAHTLNPREPMILSNWGYAVMESGDFAKSEKILRECLVMDSNNHDGLLNLGVNFMRQNRNEDAVKTLETLVAHHAQSFLGFRNLGLCYIQLREFSKALNRLQIALQIFPQYSDAKLDLAAVHFILGRKDMAAAQVKEVQNLEPENQRAFEMQKQIGES